MDASERDEITMLSAPDFRSNDCSSSTGRAISIRKRSASMSRPMNSLDSSENEHNLVGFTGPLRHERRTPLAQMSGPFYVNRNREFIFEPPQGALRQKTSDPKNKHLLRSGQLGMCNHPYCTICPTLYNVEWRQKQSKSHDMIYGDEKGWVKRMCSFLRPYVFGIMNPHAKLVQQWNKFFMISCLFAMILDPFFFFLLYVRQENKCIALDLPWTKTIAILRSLTDFVYWLHILLQFRLAQVTGSGDLVDDPKRIARHYLCGYFVLDFLAALPQPLVLTLFILPASAAASGANYTKNILFIGIFIQFVLRMIRIFPRISINSYVLYGCILVSHAIGLSWYLFGLQRVGQCFQDACRKSNITNCMEFIDCGHGNDYRKFRNDAAWELWKKNENATACFRDGGFDFGIYKTAVNLTTQQSGVKRYVYSLFWGFQQLSTLAGNQVPSYNVGEVIFTMLITGTGLCFVSIVIGHMQNFVHALLGKRKIEMHLRRRDVEQWMRHRHLPEELRRQVRDSERFTWAATRWINEEMLIENFPEDLQREIRLHLFKSVEKFPIFQLLDEPIINAICERLRTKAYFKGSGVLIRGGLVDTVVFIIRGKMESIGGDGIAVPLSEGNVCGEELLLWCLKQYKDGRRIRIPGHRLLSNRLVRCLTDVEAFVLRAADLEEVANLFPRFLRIPHVRGAIRFESPYRRGFPARRVQAAWRYRKIRRNGADSSRPLRN